MTTTRTDNTPFPSNRKVPEDFVAVGDLESDAKGSGARKNAGKAEMDLVPVDVWLRTWRTLFLCDTDYEALVSRLHTVLESLRDFQEGDDSALDFYFSSYAAPCDMEEAVKVFEFGARKYKAWNWAKGMPWSVPTGCILRHARSIIVDGEYIDPESGLGHMGHIICNVIMLQRYATHYTEGDDRPPQ